jgi:hypothetical protein
MAPSAPRVISRLDIKVQRSLGSVVLLLFGFTSIAHAEGYFSYSYQKIDVMAGDAEYARTLAHNAHRLDMAARKLVDWDSGAPLPPTHVFVLHHAAFAKLVAPEQFESSFRMVLYATSAFAVRNGENYALMDAEATSDYSGAYFGLAGSILLGEGLRYPAWFSTGLARMIAPTQIRGTKVTVGRVDPWLAQVVKTWRLRFISTRLLLTLSPDDQAFKGDLMQEKYTAECWLLVHLITIEGIYKAEFTQYLRLLDAGKDPSDAFTASFNVAYEDLDKTLKDTVDGGSIRSLSFDVPDESNTDQSRKLGAAEADGRIAHLIEIVHPRSQ